jgi:hypothetical protein
MVTHAATMNDASATKGNIIASLRESAALSPAFRKFAVVSGVSMSSASNSSP